MEIRLEKPRNGWDRLRLHGLYLNAFPAAERKPFGIIRRMNRQGRADVWKILCDGKFAGFAATVNGGDMVLLDYLAVHKRCRGMGIGSAAMALLLECYAHKGFFVEIESTREEGLDRAAREKRKWFYLSAGLAELGVGAQVFGVKMELLGVRCTLDFAGYQNFYRDHYSPWAAEHLEQLGN